MSTPVATAAAIVEPFGASAGAGFINNPIPVASQIGVTPGAASFPEGFPPVNFEATEDGGVPPAGADFNGILYMISAFCAMMTAGQIYPYNAAVSTAIGGYKLGAVLSAASGIGLWISTTAANVTDPDTGGAGWQYLGGLTNPVTVASLPAATSVPKGTRAFVTDANATTFNTTAVGSSTNAVPVFSNGTVWKIG